MNSHYWASFISTCLKQLTDHSLLICPAGAPDWCYPFTVDLGMLDNYGGGYDLARRYCADQNHPSSLTIISFLLTVKGICIGFIQQLNKPILEMEDTVERAWTHMHLTASSYPLGGSAREVALRTLMAEVMDKWTIILMSSILCDGLPNTMPLMS